MSAFFPGWELVRQIGQGSFGTVYEIRRKQLGREERAALKRITLPQNEGDVEELYSNGYTKEDVVRHYRSCLEDVLREYYLMAEMKGHTNVVNCEDVGYKEHEDGIGYDIYIRMELLTPLIKTLGPAAHDDGSEELAVKLGVDISRALMLCRQKNIIHRDIKPQNIFVSENGDFKLGDFGIAKTMERTTGGTKTGTYNYMAPEIYNNRKYGSQVDIYSLGMLLYWLLNERRGPFLPLPPAVPTARQMEQARARRFRGEKLPPMAHGSEALKRIVLKACAYSPEERTRTAQEFYEALDERAYDMRRTGKCGESARWTLKNGVLTISGNGTMEEYLVEDERGAVHSLAPWKAYRDEIKTVVIGDGVTSIGSGAFMRSESLTGITIPDSVTRIGDRAFRTTGLTAITVPDSVTEIGKWVFEWCRDLTSVRLPAGLTKISAHMFEQCENLTGFTIPDSVTEIGKGAFWNCGSLTELTIPNSVTKIEEGALHGCGFAEITIPPSLTKLEEDIFSGCGNLTKITIPDSVTEIGEGAFAGCISLPGLTIPESVTKIGLGAFARSRGLARITIPGSVTEIGDSAFLVCLGLTKVTISDGVRKIGAHAFGGCHSLTELTIPASVTKIDQVAFANCWSLAKITIPDGVTKIGQGAFGDCGSLTEITIPPSLTRLEENIFSGCGNLTKITIPASVTEIGSSAFEGCAKLTIHAPEGSYAQSYAAKNNIPFAAA